MCGLTKKSHHSKLLSALDVDKVITGIDNPTLSLFNSLCSVMSPTRSLCVFMLSQFVTTKSITPRSLVGRLVKMGICPASVIVNTRKSSHNRKDSNGVVDSLRNLLLHENYVKP